VWFFKPKRSTEHAAAAGNSEQREPGEAGVDGSVYGDGDGRDEHRGDLAGEWDCGWLERRGNDLGYRIVYAAGYDSGD
jgi:hypothetical protein